MANINDYLKWRGDIPFYMAPFNEADIMILTEMAYFPWDGVLKPGFKDPVKIKDALKALDLSGRDKNDRKMADLILKSSRYDHVFLMNFINEVRKEEDSQFCALTFKIGFLKYFIAFRGTDNTLVGWKENLNLAYKDHVPAQTKALDYLENAAKNKFGSFIIAGHSKGGNLAVYSAAFSSEKTRKRIKAVYNFDGPGFNETLLEDERFAQISDRVKTYMPQASIIGILLGRKEKYQVVKAHGKDGFDQHHLHAWEVGPEGPVFTDELSQESAFAETALNEWIGKMNYDERRDFIESVFGLMEKENFTQVSDLKPTKNKVLILKEYMISEKADKKAINKVIAALTGTVAENARTQRNEERSRKKKNLRRPQILKQPSSEKQSRQKQQAQPGGEITQSQPIRQTSENQDQQSQPLQQQTSEDQGQPLLQDREMEVEQ